MLESVSTRGRLVLSITTIAHSALLYTFASNTIKINQMAKYIMTPIKNRVTADGETPCYPRMLINHRISTEEIAQRLENSSTFTRGDVIGVICALGEALATEIAAGNTVYLDGIGRFSPGLKLKKGVAPEVESKEDRRNASSIEIGIIHFRADKQLLQECNMRTELSRAKASPTETPRTSVEERYEMAVRYITDKGFLRVMDYRWLTGLSSVKASRELRVLAQEQKLMISGRGSHIVYTLPEATI